jgi:hypothetical protein
LGLLGALLCDLLEAEVALEAGLDQVLGDGLAAGGGAGLLGAALGGGLGGGLLGGLLVEECCANTAEESSSTTVIARLESRIRTLYQPNGMSAGYDAPSGKGYLGIVSRSVAIE